MTALDVLIEEGLAERATRLGEQFRNDIRALRSPLVKEVRGRGLFNAIVIDESASSRARTAWQFCLLLKSRGVLAKPTHVNMYVCVYDLYPEYANDDKTMCALPLKASGSRLRWSSLRRTSRNPLGKFGRHLLILIRFGFPFSTLHRTIAHFSSFGSSRKFQARWKARKVSAMRSATKGYLPKPLYGWILCTVVV